MYLGLDLGTSSVKAVVMSETGEVVAEASEPLSVERPGPRMSEQNPDELVARHLRRRGCAA